jgi:hypothetical protein
VTQSSNESYSSPKYSLTPEVSIWRGAVYITGFSTKKKVIRFRERCQRNYGVEDMLLQNTWDLRKQQKHEGYCHLPHPSPLKQVIRPTLER